MAVTTSYKLCVDDTCQDECPCVCVSLCIGMESIGIGGGGVVGAQ